MLDRSSRPRYCLHATPHVLVDQVLEQHRSRQTYRQIAQQLPVAPSTIAQLLQRVGLHRLADLEAAPVNRYEYARPSQLLHPDIKKLASFPKPGHRVTGNRQINSNGIVSRAPGEKRYAAAMSASRLYDRRSRPGLG